ncbi:MAG: SHOCT domain-containing protein [Sphingomonas sp.]
MSRRVWLLFPLFVALGGFLVMTVAILIVGDGIFALTRPVACPGGAIDVVWEYERALGRTQSSPIVFCETAAGGRSAVTETAFLLVLLPCAAIAVWPVWLLMKRLALREAERSAFRIAIDAAARASDGQGAAGAARADAATRLAELRDLHESGLIDAAEYEAKKAQILGDL